MTLGQDNQETGVPLRGFVAVAAVIVVGAFAAVWMIFPAPNTRHDLISPSGAAKIELAELCGDTGCDRVVILDVGGVRSGCPLPVQSDRPLFGTVTAAWSADESSVDLDYVAEDGTTGSLAIAQADCNLTQ